MSDVSDLDWLMTKIRDGVVGLGVGWRNHVTLKPKTPYGRERVLDCDDSVYRLETLGLVYLEPDGPVTHTKEGRRRLVAAQRSRGRQRVAARDAVYGDVYAPADVQVAA
jgi:hypothetical protein